MEKTHDFRYMRNNHCIINNNLIMAIPGENHSTNDNDELSLLQERKTQEIIQRVIPSLNKASGIIIYNHTQGAYNREMGSFRCASRSLNQFIQTLPRNISKRVFVQSHNHWSHTQFMLDDDIHYILNNAGLHEGIFNMISLNSLSVDCYDVDPNAKMTTRLNLFEGKERVASDEALISRFYPDPQVALRRKEKTTVQKSTRVLPVQNSINPSGVGELKKKIFG